MPRSFQRKLHLLYHSTVIALKRFIRNTIRGYMFPQLFYSKQSLRFPEGNIFTLESISRDKRVVLMYNSHFGSSLFSHDFQYPEDFEITTDRRRLPEADIVVFHLPSLGMISHLKKPKGQLWVAWTMECEAHYPRWQKPGFMERFDIRANYHLNSDIPLPYLYPGLEASLTAPVKPKKRGNLVSFFASNYNERSGRTRYVSELMKSLDVHSYGQCLRNRKLQAEKDNYQGKMETFASYKFNLAFENAIAPDYVTEKFFHPLSAGCVPVYLGAPNIEQFAPGRHCFINTSDFQSPRELAEYLKWLDIHDGTYQEYFKWKKRPLKPSFLKIMEMRKDHAFVKLFQLAVERMGFQS